MCEKCSLIVDSGLRKFSVTTGVRKVFVGCGQWDLWKFCCETTKTSFLSTLSYNASVNNKNVSLYNFKPLMGKIFASRFFFV